MYPEKVQLQTAFGFWSIPCKKSRQRPEMYPEKTFRPDNFRLPFPTDREDPQATRCDNPKKYSSRLPSAFGQFSAKSPTSLRNCALKRRSGRTTFGCLFPPTARLPKWPAAMTRKRAAPDDFRLLVDPLQKASPAFGDVPRKNIQVRQLPVAFFPPTARLPRRPAAMTRKSAAPDDFRLLVNPPRESPPAVGDVP